MTDLTNPDRYADSPASTGAPADWRAGLTLMDHARPEPTDSAALADWMLGKHLVERALLRTEQHTIGGIMAHLVTRMDIGERWSMGSTAVQRMVEQAADFPDPVGRIGKSEVYWWPEVQAWNDVPRVGRAVGAA